MTVELCSGPDNATWTSTVYTCTVNGVDNYVYQWDVPQEQFFVSESVYGTMMKRCWVKWGSDVTTTLEVTLADGTGPVTSYRMLPEFDDVVATINAGKLVLTVPKNRCFRVDLNGNTTKPLYVFSSMLEDAIPEGSIDYADWIAENPDAKTVAAGTKLHFSQGTWTIPTRLEIQHNCTVHIGRDALVLGNFSVEAEDETRFQGITFQGTGCLANPSVDWHEVILLPTFEDCIRFSAISAPHGQGSNFFSSNVAKGITFFAVPFHLAPRGIFRWEDTQYIAYIFDGYSCSPELGTGKGYRIRTFCEAGDDAHDGLPFAEQLDEDCVVGTRLNGCWKFCYWAYNDWTTVPNFTLLWNKFVVKNCHAYHLGLADNNQNSGYPQKGAQTIFHATVSATDAQGPTWGRFDVQIDGLTVHGAVNSRLFYIANRKYPYTLDPVLMQDAAGCAARFSIKNVVVKELPGQKSVLIGRDENNTPHDITFENITIDGTELSVYNFTDYVETNDYPYNIFIQGLSFDNIVGLGTTIVNGAEIYKGPGTDVYKSTRYSATVNNESAYVWGWTDQARQTNCDVWETNQEVEVSWLKVGSNNSIQVEISKLNGPVTSAIVYPREVGVSQSIVGGKLRLTVPSNRRLRIEINGDRANAMHLFVQPPQVPVPTTYTDFRFLPEGTSEIPEGETYYFGPGVHNIGHLFKCNNNCTIFIDANAVVIGSFDLRGTDGVVIQGNGNISGQYAGDPLDMFLLGQSGGHAAVREYSTFYGYDGIKWSFNNRVQGVTVFAAAFFLVEQGVYSWRQVSYLAPYCYGVALAFGLNGKNFPSEPTGEVIECFAFTGDDCQPAGGGFLNTVIRDSFFVTSLNGCFWLGYGALPQGSESYLTLIENCHAMHLSKADTDTDNTYPQIGSNTIFHCIADTTDENSGLGRFNVTIKNLKVWGPIRSRLFFLKNRPYPYIGGQTPLAGAGQIANWTIQNLTTEFVPEQVSILEGKDNTSTPHDILFDNVILGGIRLTQQNITSYVRLNQFPYNIVVTGPPPRTDPGTGTGGDPVDPTDPGSGGGSSGTDPDPIILPPQTFPGGSTGNTQTGDGSGGTDPSTEPPTPGGGRPRIDPPVIITEPVDPQDPGGYNGDVTPQQTRARAFVDRTYKKIPIYPVANEQEFLNIYIPTRIEKISAIYKDASPFTTTLNGRKISYNNEIFDTVWNVANGQIELKSFAPSEFDVFARFYIRDLTLNEEGEVGTVRNFTAGFVPVTLCAIGEHLFILGRETYRDKTFYVLKICPAADPASGAQYLESVADFLIDIPLSRNIFINQLQETPTTLGFSEKDPSIMLITTNLGRQIFYKLYFDYYYNDVDTNKVYFLESYPNFKIQVT